MKTDVSAGMSGISFSPRSTAAEVIQNVRCILSTRKGTVPFDRAFGVSWDMLDKPLPVAKAMLIAAVVEAIQEYEPRALVRGVTFSADADAAMEGRLLPVVSIEIDEDAAANQVAELALAARKSSSGQASSPSSSSVAQQAEQAAAAASLALATVNGMENRLHELETTDYSAIYDQA